MKSLSAAVGTDVPVTAGFAPRSKWNDLQRYLILGASDGVYYAGDPRLSVERAGVVLECLAEDGLRVVNAVLEAAGSGRAPRLDPVLFALAVAASPKYADTAVNAAALKALPSVAHTAIHLKKFATYVTAHRGWGRSLRSAFADWYLQMPVRDLAQQMLKQRRRGRWSHSDLLRLSHPKPENKAQSVLFRWAVEGELSRVSGELLYGDLKQVYGFEIAKKASDKREVIDLIEAYQLTYEMVPERWLAFADIWEALLDNMPYCAMLRNLGKLTSAGLITSQGESTALVAARLVDNRRIARAKANPVTLLDTLVAFRQKHDVPAISSALETAFYASFANLNPLGRRTGIALDSAAAAASTIVAMWMSREKRLDTVTSSVRSAQPHLDTWPDVDGLVVVLGQNGWIKPPRPSGLPLVVVAPNAAQPEFVHDDPDMLQIVGFDATVPRAIQEFVGVT
jgi:60 kDa SS-A/Ro ribonucleoprotein